MFCFADATGEALAARLRPGNAAANDAADNLEVLDDAITQLPADVAAGHCVDDDLGEVRRRVMVRSDSAGCTAGFVDGCRSRNIGFAVVARRKTAVSAAVAVANTDNDRWVPALNQDGTPAQPIHQDDGDDKVAMVCEVTDLVDLSSWPKGTRLIVRREPLHPGAQTSLLPDLEYRFWGHYTDQDGDPATLIQRSHCPGRNHMPETKQDARADDGPGGRGAAPQPREKDTAKEHLFEQCRADREANHRFEESPTDADANHPFVPEEQARTRNRHSCRNSNDDHTAQRGPDPNATTHVLPAGAHLFAGETELLGKFEQTHCCGSVQRHVAPRRKHDVLGHVVGRRTGEEGGCDLSGMTFI